MWLDAHGTDISERSLHVELHGYREVLYVVQPAGTSEPGYTFSNLPWSSGLINRADRILVRNMPYILSQPNTTVTTYERHSPRTFFGSLTAHPALCVCLSGRVTPGANPASDHLAVASHVSYVTNNTWTRP